MARELDVKMQAAERQLLRRANAVVKAFEAYGAVEVWQVRKLDEALDDYAAFKAAGGRHREPVRL